MLSDTRGKLLRSTNKIPNTLAQYSQTLAAPSITLHELLVLDRGLSFVAREGAGAGVVTLGELVDRGVLELASGNALLKETVELSVGAAL